MEANKSWFTPEALAEDKLRVASLCLNQAREALRRELTYALQRKDKGAAARIQTAIFLIFGPLHDGSVVTFDDFCKAADARTNTAKSKENT